MAIRVHIDIFEAMELPLVKVINITIKNRLSNISKALEEFSQFAMDCEINVDSVSKIKIALDELLGNVIKYAFIYESEHHISMEVKVGHNNVSFTIMDDGVHFDPFQHDTPNTTLSLEEREIGGLGIHITKHIMDGYSYDRQGDMNIITLIKELQ